MEVIMEEYSRENPVLRPRIGNRILCITTIAMVAIQFLMVFIGIYDTLPLVLGTQLSVLLIPVIGVCIAGIDVRETFRIRRVSLKTVVFALLIILCSYPVVAFLNMLSMLFVENAVAETATALYQDGFFISMVVMALLPAIGEEFLMRGVVYRSYRKKSPVLAWILSAVIFGLLHMNFNQMPYAIYLGLLMVIMMEATDSIITPMLMHFFMNGISTMSGYFSDAVLETTQDAAYASEGVLETSDGVRLALLSIGILALIMIPLILLIIRATFRANGRKLSDMFKKEEEPYSGYTLPEVDESQNILDLWLIIAILVIVIITALNTFM
jgi:hypothetical protein